MKRLNISLACLVLVMVITASIGSAMAYFTDSTSATGGGTVKVTYSVTPHEEVTEHQKRFTLTADPDSLPLYVRARGFSGDQQALSCDGANWTFDGEWYVWQGVLHANETTDELVVTGLPFPKDDEKVEEDDTFNVIVIYEYALAQYDEDGNPILPPVFDEGGDN